MTRLATATAIALALLLAAAQPASGAAPGWVWPVRGKVVTPYRNGGDPYAAGQHRGIDIAGPVGAPVVAAAGGVVRFAGTVGTSGLTVGIRTADGRYDTSYLHLSSVSVREGDHVAAGERVGAVGTTGRRSAARPHLHFGVRDAGSRHAYHDPLELLPPPARPRPAPRGTPAPVGAPARPSPVPFRHGIPTRLPEPLSDPMRRRAPQRAPRPLPALRPLPGLHGVPSAAARRSPARRGAPEAGPAAAPEPGTHPASVPHPSREAPDRSSRPDLGWVLACLGLLLAAALAGVGGDRRDDAARLPARLGALLRPLVGRG